MLGNRAAAAGEKKALIIPIPINIMNKNGIFDNESKKGIKKELGDVLWYISNLCTELNFNLEDVALQNLEKLKLRAAKGKIRGSGDDR